MLSQRHQFYLAIIVLIIVGIFFFPDLYKDAKTEHEFCCSSFNGKIESIKLDSNTQWFLELEEYQEYYFDKFLSNKDIEDIAIGDSLVKQSGSLAMTLYRNGKVQKEINKESASSCECE